MFESEKISVFETQYYKMFKSCVQFIGCWPFENANSKLFKRILVLILLTSLVIPQCVRLFEELNHDMDIVLELLGSLCYFIGCIAKYSTTISADKALRYLYEQINYHWQIITDAKEQELLNIYTGQSQLISHLYMGVGYFALLLYCSMPIIFTTLLDIFSPLNESRRKLLPYYAEYFIDDQIYYFEILSHGSIVFTLSVAIYTSVDTMYACCAQHVCGLFAIVNHRLQSATKNQYDCHMLKKNETVHEQLSKAIALHQESLAFADLMDQTYAMVYLPVLGLNLMAITFCAVDIVLHIGDMKEMIRMSVIYAGFVFHLLFNSIPGQKIHDMSCSVFRAAYFSEWYNISLESRNLVNFIMLRSLTPSQFTAGGLFILNMENFGMIVKSSISYMTVIMSMHQ